MDVRFENKGSWTLKIWCFWSVVLEKTLVLWSAGKSNQSILKKISLECSWKDWCWSWNSNTLANWCKELAHLKRPWCWERLKAGGQGDDRGWNHWMSSLTRWIWVWASVDDGQGGMAGCNPWSYKELDMTDPLNSVENFIPKYIVFDQLYFPSLNMFSGNDFAFWKRLNSKIVPKNYIWNNNGNILKNWRKME